jgi:hypothetical protein
MPRPETRPAASADRALADPASVPPPHRRVVTAEAERRAALAAVAHRMVPAQLTAAQLTVARLIGSAQRSSLGPVEYHFYRAFFYVH